MSAMKSRIFAEFEEMEKQMGRMFRNMSFPQMISQQSKAEWLPAANVYETKEKMIIFMEASGLDPEKINISVESRNVTISGVRQIPSPENKCTHIHQLEIEQCSFNRSFSLSVPIDIESATSVYKNGLLEIILPKLQAAGKIKIKVK